MYPVSSTQLDSKTDISILLSFIFSYTDGFVKSPLRHHSRLRWNDGKTKYLSFDELVKRSFKALGG